MKYLSKKRVLVDNLKSCCLNLFHHSPRQVLGFPHTLLKRVSVSWADEPEIEPEITILRLDSPRKSYSRGKMCLGVLFRPLHEPQRAVSKLNANALKRDKNTSVLG